jgi:UDP-2,4-diacetamido-2,4,6-trideoxy-beta-L-altropyranose hydrolase
MNLNMRVLVRADASILLGSGHVLRCLTLADQLSSAGAAVAFVCARRVGTLSELIRAHGYDCAEIEISEKSVYGPAIDAEMTLQAARRFFPMGLDWLVVDHYGLDGAWQTKLRPHVGRILVIDDLANRAHNCDLLLDQNYYRYPDDRYKGLLPKDCITLLGPRHVLLRQEFIEAREQLRSRDGQVRRILVFFGGTDPGNQTKLALLALQRWNRVHVALDVVVGVANPHAAEISNICDAIPNATFHCQTRNMANLIANADLGIGSGGSSMWERSYLGLPTITVSIAENQARTTEDVADRGCVVYLGHSNFLRVEDYLDTLESLAGDPSRIRQISEMALSLVDPCGTSLARVMQDILSRPKLAGCG